MNQPPSRLRINKVEIPAFQKRGLIISGTPKTLKSWIDFAAKNRLNAIGLRDFHYYYRITEEAHRRGIKLSVYQHNLGADLCSHKAKSLKSSLQPFQQYLEQIPVRTKELYCWPSDYFIERCACSYDRNIPTTDLLLKRLNHLITSPSVRKSQSLSFFAHLGTWQTPHFEVPNSKIFLTLAPEHRCFSHAINDPFCKINTKYVKPQIEELLKIFPPQTTEVMGYWLNAALFGRVEFEHFGWAFSKGVGRIPHIPAIVKKDLTYYQQLNIQRIMSFAIGVDEAYCKQVTSPMISLFPQLLWSPDSEISTLLRDFTLHYYGSTRFHLFFDENELIDPKDISKVQFSAFLSLAEQRKKLLEEYLTHTPGERFQDPPEKKKALNKPLSPKIKNRIKLLIKEQDLKGTWKKHYVSVKIKGVLSRSWYQIKKMRC